MALKIKSQIGCDQGITSEAYVRIDTYFIDKVNGSINIKFSAYLNEEASKVKTNSPLIAPQNRLVGQPIRNLQIGENLSIPLKKEITEIVTTTQQVPVEKDVEKKVETTVDGVTTTQNTTEKQTVYEPQEISNEIKSQVPDMSLIAGTDIFVFCYAKLKEFLLTNFKKVEDC